jgi:7-keto-8-aminopelargonate synthetase-like enzyme
VIGHLFSSGDLVLYDELSHDSLLQGIRLSGATGIPFITILLMKRIKYYRKEEPGTAGL